MTILETDIKLLKSAVMADTTDGGGAMTGTEIADGASNNIFPDTSELDRALGRVSMRKVFGVVQTDNTDSLLGTHAMLLDAPDDPLVGCLMMDATAWGDTRTEAQAKIEQYLVKGPRKYCRLFEDHYAGSLQIRLYIAGASNDDFPAANDTIVLRRPSDSVEQYVRIRKTTRTAGSFTVSEGGTIITVYAQILTCDLSTELKYTFPGAPIARVLANEATSYSSVYSTTSAVGAKFYGVKPLAEAASTGDRLATVDGGIFGNLVPAATTPTALTDQDAYTNRSALTGTAAGQMVFQMLVYNTVGTLQYLPTAVLPGTFSADMTPALVDDGAGNLVRNGATVGVIDYANGTFYVTNSAGVVYANWTISYTPATAASGPVYSTDYTVTAVNQSLVYTNIFEPLPARGSFKLSYMAQGRWYDISDQGDGRLAGADSSYGSGSISYATGSVSFTLGALPDVGSALVATWCENTVAIPPVDALPDRFYTELDLGGTATSETTISLSWEDMAGGSTRTGTIGTNGLVVSADATGYLENGKIIFKPKYFVNGNVTATLTTASLSTLSSYVSPGNWTLSTLPVRKSSFKANLVVGSVPSGVLPFTTFISVYDKGDGVLYAKFSQQAANSGAESVGSLVQERAIGTIDYTTGAVALSASISMLVNTYAIVGTSDSGGFRSFQRYVFTRETRTIPLTSITGFVYAAGTGAASTVVLTPITWKADVPLNAGGSLITNDVAFKTGHPLDFNPSGSRGRILCSKDGGLRMFATTANTQINEGSPLDGSTVGSDGRILIPHDTLVAIRAGDSNTPGWSLVMGPNLVYWMNVAISYGGANSDHGVFRTATAPLQPGVFQMLRDTNVTTGDDAGVLTGGGVTGTVDYERGLVKWATAAPVDASEITYNAVFLEFVPLDPEFLGLETARLPSDGKVPIYRSGGICVVHNTQTTALPNPLVKDTPYDLGRERLAAVKVIDSAGTTVPNTLYTADLDAGTLTVPTASVITSYAQPFTVHHRIEDMLLCSKADISGELTFTRTLTHDYPADTSYVSSALIAGDLNARSTNSFEQVTWTGVWSNTRIGSAPTANYNETLYPIAMSNRGAITERWALIFTNTTTFNIVGESVGVIGTGTTGATCAPLNPASGTPFFSVPAGGWGAGWATGNVYRFNTFACGVPLWLVRTVLQGPATLADDKFSIAFRGDVDRP